MFELMIEAPLGMAIKKLAGSVRIRDPQAPGGFAILAYVLDSDTFKKIDSELVRKIEAATGRDALNKTN